MRLIDADEIVYESIDSCDTGRHESYYGTGILAVRKEDIDVAPTIDPVRKGKWIDGKCDQCGGEAYWKRGREVYGWREFALELTKYCPNCGAKMEEGEQE